MPKNVLLVGINVRWWKQWEKEFRDQVTFTHEVTTQEAREAFAKEKFDAIVTVAWSGERPATTAAMVRDFRRTFEGPIIVVSSYPERRKPNRNGCSHSCQRDGVVPTLRASLVVPDTPMDGGQ